jgi:hypothetical protein
MKYDLYLKKCSTDKTVLFFALTLSAARKKPAYKIPSLVPCTLVPSIYSPLFTLSFSNTLA